MNYLVLTQYHDVFIHYFLNNKSVDKIYRFNYSLADKIYYNAIYSKYNIVSISYNLSYFSYSDSINQEVESLFYSSIDYMRFPKKKNKNKFKKLLQKYTLFYNQVDIFFQKNNVDLILTWNGMNILDLIVISIAKKYNIKYIVYEMGLFRPNTLTIDRKKVNYRNSVPQEIKFYKNNIFNTNINIPEKTNYKVSSKILYSCYKIHDHVLFLLGIFTLKRFDGIVKISFAKKQSNKYISLDEIQNDTFNIFLPMQVSYDTQILINSPKIKTMEEFIQVVLKNIESIQKRLKKKICLCIKEHPKEKLYFKSLVKNEYIKFLEPSISSKNIINKTDMTMTINSTVGLESIELNKPTIVFGNAFYAIEPIAYKIEDFNMLDKIIYQAYTSTDYILQNKFIRYLKNYYQLPYNPDTIMMYDNKLHIQKVLNV